MKKSDQAATDSDNMPYNKDTQSGTTGQQTPTSAPASAGQQPSTPSTTQQAPQAATTTQQPQQPAGQAAGTQQQGGKQPNGNGKPGDFVGYNWKPKKHYGKYIGAVVILAVVAVLAFYVFTQFNPKPPPVINTTNTSSFNGEILGCETIKVPGSYYIGQSFSTHISSGSCIQVESSNVRITGNSDNITGNGPYSTTVPPTFGININHVSNVSIDALSVSRFSYGIFVNGSTDVTITNSTLKTSTIAGVESYYSQGTTLYHDNVTEATSNSGALVLQGGGNTLVQDTLIQNNAYFGAYVNSSSNKFLNDRFLNNPVDLFCNSTNGFRSYNKFINTSCNFNTGCNFASCSQTNVPFNTSQSLLYNNVNGCGIINYSGIYTLQRSLSTPDYVNTSAVNSRYDACIYVNDVPNVEINCNGQSISSGYYGIYVQGGPVGIFNISLENCRFSNDTYGAYIYHVFNQNVTNTRISNSTYGIYLDNVTEGAIKNLTGTGGTYGVYVNQVTGVSYTGISLSRNVYGIYVENSGGNIYENDKINSSNSDFYCSRTTYNQTSNVYHNVSCSVTDCSWATSCAVHRLPPVGTYYISACQTITVPGNFALSGSVLGSNNCFRIESNNVSFSCDGHTVESNSGLGTAFSISGATNVSINNCNIQDYAAGISAFNSNQVEIGQIKLNNTAAILSFQNVNGSTVFNVSGSGFRNYGFVFNQITYSTITNDVANGGVAGASGFSFAKASNDNIAFDTAQGNQGYGFSFITAKNNNIYNNTAGSNLDGDYFCAPDSSGIYADNGINIGLSKTGCTWMAVQSSDELLRPTCQAIDIPGTTVLSADMVYTYGSTCFSAYNLRNATANGDVFNCNGHTVIATHGGTFFDALNATGVMLENCYLEGFGTAVLSTANSFKLYNDTIASSNVSVMLTNVHGIYNTNVSYDTFTNDSFGVFGSKLHGSFIFGTGVIQHNLFENANVAVQLNQSTYLNVSFNSGNARNVGIQLISSNEISMDNNHINAPIPLLNGTESSQTLSSGSNSQQGASQQALAMLLNRQQAAAAFHDIASNRTFTGHMAVENFSGLNQSLINEYGMTNGTAVSYYNSTGGVTDFATTNAKASAIYSTLLQVAQAEVQYGVNYSTGTENGVTYLWTNLTVESGGIFTLTGYDGDLFVRALLIAPYKPDKAGLIYNVTKDLAG